MEGRAFLKVEASFLATAQMASFGGSIIWPSIQQNEAPGSAQA
jgi:hypothetical protein